MYFIKKMIKKLFVSVAFVGCPKIVIASTGRAGSTMLFQAIADSLVQTRFGVSPESSIGKLIKRMCMGYVDRIKSLPSETCVVCKTHDTYENPAKMCAKYIFVYGDPLDSAMSVEQVVEKKGQEWFVLHQFHLKANGEYRDLYNKDVLNYQGQLETWLATTDANVLCIEYDELWSKNELLSKFIGFDIILPVRRPRIDKPKKHSVNEKLFDRLRKVKEKLKADYDVYCKIKT
jgi:hypothetical protein